MTSIPANDPQGLCDPHKYDSSAKEGHVMEDLQELIEDGGIIVSSGKLFVQWEDEK